VQHSRGTCRRIGKIDCWIQDLANDVTCRSRVFDRASNAALDHLGEGRVTETEVGDEESYYEIEVTLDDGTQTDVQLDRSINVVGSESDTNDTEANDD